MMVLIWLCLHSVWCGQAGRGKQVAAEEPTETTAGGYGMLVAATEERSDINILDINRSTP
jgi:hypothetical protein